MSTYDAPIRDMQFVIKELVGLENIANLEGKEEITEELVDAVLSEAGKFAKGVLDPINFSGDRIGAILQRQEITSPEGFKEAYRKFCDAGWISVANDEQWGGQGLPHVLSGQTSEMWNAACMSFCLCPMLTAGAVHALSRHGTDEQKSKYLPNLVNGKWTGTMQLTEPQAGSDLSAVRTRATQESDFYRIKGTKIYITWGEHDLTENIIHLVLARTPDAPEGVKGISLFVVPKYLVNDDGSLGERNDVKCISIEEKLGIHASPTCVMSYGDDEGAIGYLIGEENRGLEYMFTMMNFARIEVGIEGLGISDRSYQRALEYSKTRIQGRDLDIKNGVERVPIIKHPDVRRMLMIMKSQTEAMRALTTATNAHLDRALGDRDPEIRKAHQALFDLLTPVVKGWCTEQSVEIASIGVQIHGGMGFVEETGAAQYLRDARITPIYEGTTGIQANDLVGRKIAYEKGATIKILIGKMRELDLALKKENGTIELAQIQAKFSDGLERLEHCVHWLLEVFPKSQKKAYAGSVPFLKLFGVVCGAWKMAESAMIASRKLEQGSEEQDFYQGKIVTTLFYMEHILSLSAVYSDMITQGAESTLLLREEQF